VDVPSIAERDARGGWRTDRALSRRRDAGDVLASVHLGDRGDDRGAGGVAGEDVGDGCQSSTLSWKSGETMSTVLAHVVMSIRDRENAATRALWYIVNQRPKARRALERLIRAAFPDLPADLNYRLQPGGKDDNGRPDMIGRLPNGQEVLLIESKLWAGLTEKQPVSYLRRLSERGLLLFLLPKQRMNPLKQEIDGRLQGTEFSDATRWKPENDRAIVRFRSAGEQKAVALIGWEDLLDEIKRDVENSDPSAAADIDQLRGLCEEAGAASTQFVAFDSEFLSGRETPALLQSLVLIVDDAVKDAVEGLQFQKGAGPAPEADSYGYYLDCNGARVWFGAYTSAWRRFGLSPLWFQFSREHAKISWDLVCAIMQCSYPNMSPYDMDDSWYVPALLQANQPKHVVLDGIRTQFSDIKNEFKKV
jgi:hypothetical protein